VTERIGVHFSEHRHRRLPPSFHGIRRDLIVRASRPGTKSDKDGQAIPHRDVIGPQSRRSAIAVREWMNANPLGVNPGTQIDDSGQLIGRQVLTRLYLLIENRDGTLQGLLELRQSSRDQIGSNAVTIANLYANSL
jgi:hypothetical protein